MTRSAHLFILALMSSAAFTLPVTAASAQSSEPAAAEVTPVKAPSDPLAKAAFDVLRKHCARCHQAGELEGRDKVASNFGNVLNMEDMANDTRFVLAGNPDASELIKRTADPVRADMPYDVRNAELTGEDSGYPTPTEQEIAALRDWVTSLGETQTASCSPDKFMSHDAVVETIAEDLNNRPDHLVKGTRYITLSHLANICTDEKKMNVFRQAVVKLLNSLSRNSDVVRLETVDEAGTIIRFHIADLLWSEADWNLLLANYPYAVKPESKMFSFLQTSTNSELPYVRGDWFAFAASRPKLYHALLKLPDSFQELQKQFGLNIEANLKGFLAERAGFQKSGVSQNNRLIERHTIPTGVFWTSYDFAGNREKQSLFEFPLGPGGESGFDADGGESIFSLPNGFHAYYLNEANGKRLDKGPTEIVRDISRKDFAVTNGISCFGCHDQGIRYNKDDIREHVLANRSFPKQVRDEVKALYPTAEAMKRRLDEDQVAWANAMKRAGLDPNLTLNKVEMINALSDQYERQDLTMRTAAAEFGMSTEEFSTELGNAGGEAFALKRRLEQGLVPRDHFEVVYSKIVPMISDNEVLAISGATEPAEPSGSAETKPAEEGKKPVVADKVSKKERISSGSFHLILFSDKSFYKVKDHAVFSVKTEVDCFLTLINVDKKNKATVIFPNRFQKDNFLKAGKALDFPGPSAGFKFLLRDPGVEKVIATCSQDKNADPGVKHDFAKSAFTDLGDYRKFSTRAIIVVPDGAGKKEKVKKEEKKIVKKQLAARTAIKFEVH
ncbi:MAG: DUF4384 domain-containing protein [Pseudomonadota bacterium]